MSKIYKLSLTQKSGLLTELQSDTVFGHFCWRMKELYGEDKLKKFLDLYMQRKPVFTLSNSFLEHNGVCFLPNPILPGRDHERKNTKEEKIRAFLDFKDSKKIKLLTLGQFNLALKGDTKGLEESLETVKVDRPSYFEDLRTSVEISRETFSNEKSQLFSYAPRYPVVNSELKRERVDATVIFVKVLEPDKFLKEFECEKILKEVFSIGFGKKKSSGYGEFDVKSFEEFKDFKEPEDANGFITLSNYIPSKDDGITANGSYYQHMVKYGKLGEEFALGNNPFKKPIVFMTPGSCFITDKKAKFYGRSVTGIAANDKILQCGIAFTLSIMIHTES